MGCFWLAFAVCLGSLTDSKGLIYGKLIVTALLVVIGLRNYRAFMGEEEYKALLMQDTHKALDDKALADLDIPGRLGIRPVDLDLIALAGLGSLRPRLEDTDGPEIFVYSDAVHSEKGLVQNRSFIILSGQSRLSLGVDVGIRLL